MVQMAGNNPFLILDTLSAYQCKLVGFKGGVPVALPAEIAVLPPASYLFIKGFALPVGQLVC
ncbi:hypothetical protein D3C80_2127940 [compost metagenome]